MVAGVARRAHARICNVCALWLRVARCLRFSSRAAPFSPRSLAGCSRRGSAEAGFCVVSAFSPLSFSCFFMYYFLALARPPVLRRTAVLVSPVHVVNFCFRLAKARFLGVGWIVTCSVFRFRFRHSFLWFSPRFFCERISTSLADLLLEHSGPNLSQRMLSRNTFWSSKIFFV